MNVIDATNEAAPATVCSPNAPTPAECPLSKTKIFDLNFSAALNAGTVLDVEVEYGTCTPGVNCPKGTLDMATNTIHLGTATARYQLDMSGVTYNAATKTLNEGHCQIIRQCGYNAESIQRDLSGERCRH